MDLMSILNIFFIDPTGLLRSIPHNTGIGEMFGSSGAVGAGGTVIPNSPMAGPGQAGRASSCNDRWERMNETANNSRWESTSDGRIYGNDNLAHQVEAYRSNCHKLGHVPPGTPDRVALDRTLASWNEWWK
jgi:hypothetical protein